MTRSTLTIIVGLIVAPLAATAQRLNSSALMSDHLEALRSAGFSGMSEVQVLQVAIGAAIPAAVQVDETTEAMEALRRESKENARLDGEIIRALGIDFNGDFMPIKYLLAPKFQDVIRLFNVTPINGTADIIIQEVRKVGDRKEMRSYRISPNGHLEAAALTVKIDGKVQAAKITVADAQAGCRELIEFWTRYYRENLKKP